MNNADPSGAEAAIEVAELYGSTKEFIEAFIRGVAQGLISCEAVLNDPTCRLYNSGKIQAQGKSFGRTRKEQGTGVPWHWSQMTPPLVVQGVLGLTEIWVQLSDGQRGDFTKAIGDAIAFIRSLPPNGIHAGFRKSFYNDYKRARDAESGANRIDIEVYHGAAFRR